MIRQTRCLALLGVLFCGVAQASSGGFEFSLVGGDLGKMDPDSEPPRYRIKIAPGQTITLVARGMAYPRGGAPGPLEPDAGAWLFDDAVFQLVPHEKKAFDKTQVVTSLKALKAGTTKVRFVGNVLGYDRKCEIVIDVVEKK